MVLLNRDKLMLKIKDVFLNDFIMYSLTINGPCDFKKYFRQIQGLECIEFVYRGVDIYFYEGHVTIYVCGEKDYMDKLISENKVNIFENSNCLILPRGIINTISFNKIYYTQEEYINNIIDFIYAYLLNRN